MRMLLKVSIPVGGGNKGIRDGGLPRTMSSFVEQYKPEAAYFVAEGGRRTGYFFVDLKDPATIPSMVEPFFLNLDADITFTPAMDFADMRAGVERAVNKL